MLEDKLLILKFNRGSREALQTIYAKYKDDLVTLAAALLIDVNLAEDVVHDVFVSFIESAQKFRLTGSLKGYLATCVANNARNKIKAGKRHQAANLEEAEELKYLNGPENRAIFGEELRQLSWALEQLPFEQREVLILHSYSGLKFSTIAAQQNVSINTIQGRYRYAIDKLRSLLNSEVQKCDLQKK
jgi:RNA polymerase sigma-70 factor (ECF subfamily)